MQKRLEPEVLPQKYLSPLYIIPQKRSLYYAVTPYNATERKRCLKREILPNGSRAELTELNESLRKLTVSMPLFTSCSTTGLQR